MVIPIGALLAIPLFYSAWQRRKRRREALSDPKSGMSAATKLAIKQKDLSSELGNSDKAVGGASRTE
jgi:hypothetical protein